MCRMRSRTSSSGVVGRSFGSRPTSMTLEQVFIQLTEDESVAPS